MDERRNLRFQGAICSGVGKHSEMLMPGRSALSNAPDDWPEKLCPGSLNVLIQVYPEGFGEPRGRSGGVYQLDTGSFQPALTIPGSLISANKLIHNGQPAAAQVWRSVLETNGGSPNIRCWVLRRFGSSVGSGKPGNVLEIVSDQHLRDTYGIHDGDRVALVLFEN